jgi:hypothetical protein
LAAWAILLALAAFQAYAQRYVIGPDGISYLDLSDAVTTGNWSRLLNLSWSPLYPALIGLGRAISGAGPQQEIPVVHAVNFVCFAGMLAAFEYLLVRILSIARTVRWSILGHRWGAALSYALFGIFALTMIPLELTTPDLLNAAFAFLAFGAMLRLGASSPRHAIVFGAALGIAALSKSFMIPWAIVCFVTMAIALRSRGMRPVGIAVGVWLLFVAPWTAALSTKAGRLTFGDTGRLTYAWFVNEQDPPSEGGVPPGARTARTEAILSGTGIAVDTAYTDPMWADPARWNAMLEPVVRWSDQWKTVKRFHALYVENLAPLLFLILIVVVAPRGTRRWIWKRGWIIYVPALLGLIGYAVVLVTTRYVMPFLLAGTLTMLATTPAARRMVPTLALLGLVVPFALESFSPTGIESLTFLAAAGAGLLAAVLVRSKSAGVWITVAVVAMIFDVVVFAVMLRDASLVRFGAAAVAVLFWRAALVAVRNGTTVAFAHRAEVALILVVGILLGYRSVGRYNRDVEAFGYAQNPNRGNLQWNIAQDLASHGVTPGTRVAIIGPHAEAYWARTARLHIVASVPGNRVGQFWQLPKSEQEKLLDEFAANGAQVAIATLGVVGLPPDSTWTKVKYRGRIRFLKR